MSFDICEYGTIRGSLWRFGLAEACPSAHVVRWRFRGRSAMSTVNSFGTRTPLAVAGRSYQTYSLRTLEGSGFPQVARLPYSMKVLLENLLRHEDGRFVKASDIEALAKWDLKSSELKEISFAPARVLLQD